MDSFSNLGNRLRDAAETGLNRMNNSWSDCKQVMSNTRSVSYIICMLSIVLFVSMILCWNKNFIIFLAGLTMVMAVFNAMVVSKKSCFGILDDIVGRTFEENFRR